MPLAVLGELREPRGTGRDGAAGRDVLQEGRLLGCIPLALPSQRETGRELLGVSLEGTRGCAWVGGDAARGECRTDSGPPQVSTPHLPLCAPHHLPAVLLSHSLQPPRFLCRRAPAPHGASLMRAPTPKLRCPGSPSLDPSVWGHPGPRCSHCFATCGVFELLPGPRGCPHWGRAAGFPSQPALGFPRRWRSRGRLASVGLEPAFV